MTTLLHAAVCGDPIDHSLSPVLHSAAYEYLGINADYTRLRVNESGLAAVVQGLDDTWLGLSLTMPLKEVALEVVAPREDLVIDVGAANTVFRGADGQWSLANTDVEGARSAVDRVRGDRDLSHAVVVGAGATARSVVRALPEIGVKSLLVTARKADAARSLAETAAAWGLSADAVSWSDLTAEHCATDLLVSTVPGEVAVPDPLARGVGVLLDVAYHPWPTPLAASWRGPVASGRDMLVGQALRQIALMTGQHVPADVLYSALPQS